VEDIKLKEILKHPTVSAVVGTVLGTIIATPIVAYINKVNVMDALILIFNWLTNIVTFVLSFRVPFWIILIAIFILLLCKRIFKSRNSDSPFDFITHYKNDKIDNVLWIFDWIRGLDRKYTLSKESPHPICPECKNDLVLSNKTVDGYYSSRPTGFICENCGFSQKLDGNQDEYLLKIKREIIRRVRTGEWRNSLQDH
jgi:hypothetical protein